MALKVVTNYQPKVNLKVTTKPVNYVTPKTVNPQKSVSPQPKTYNPQKTATPKQIQNYNAPANWATEQATRLRREEDARIVAQQVERKRLYDAKSGEIKGHQGNIASTLWDKASFGADRRARGSREVAYKYFKENEEKWGSSILARQRNYENKAGELKQWVVGATSQAEFDKRYSEAMRWLENEEKVINDDIKDFTKTQMDLSSYSQSPLTSKVANHFGAFKDQAKSVGSFVWKPLEWGASQPERIVNTAKNLVNPNNLRMYYGGEEKKGDLRTGSIVDNIKKAYNESKDQRTLGFSKEDEANRLAGGKPFQYKDYKTGEIKTGYTKEASGFNKLRIKYGDDVANLAVDPLNFAPNNWLVKGFNTLKGSKTSLKVSKFASTKTDDLYKWAGTKPKIADYLISREARKLNPNSFSNWLTRRVGTSVDDFKSDNKDLIKFRDDASDKLRFKTESYKSAIKDISGDIPARFGRLTDEEARIFQEYVLPQTFANERNTTLSKQIFSWDGVDLPRGFNKGNRRALEDLARDMKKSTDKLRTMGIDYAESYELFDRSSKIRKFNNRAYIPNYAVGSSVGNKKDKSMRLPDWFLKRKTGYSKQSPMQMADSFSKRVSSQVFSENKDARWLNSYADRYKAFIDDSNKTLSNRKLAYTPNTAYKPGIFDKVNTFNKFNDMAIKNKISPTKVWTKAVLAMNPAWYVNNLGTNIPFSISAGGVDVIPELFKIFKKGGRNFDDVPEEVLGKLGDYVGGGKAGRISRLADDPFRVATFRSLKKKGFSDEQAIKEVNKWFFDYKVTNAERPIKALAPFYKWQANLMRLSAQMPFSNPRSAKFYNSMNQQFIERPLNDIPNETQEYIDPDTGLPSKYNPRDGYRGKASFRKDKDGNPIFDNTPFWGLNPNSITDFGLNPMITFLQDYMTSTDKFGNRNTDKNALSLLADKLPQTSLAKSLVNKNNKDSTLWFSQNGSSKSKQGFDKNKPNYDKFMDNQQKFVRKIKSFVGIPNSVTFDKKNYDDKYRLTKFNKDFFAIDWNKRYDELKDLDEKNGTFVAFDTIQKEQFGLAKKYGFDMQKDIYENYWSKYDTTTTTNTKRKKQDAREFASDFWNDYLSIPAGSKTSASKRRPFVIEKYREWGRDNTFAENGYRDIPQFSVYKDGKKTEEKSPKNPFTLQAEQDRSKTRGSSRKKPSTKYLEYQKAKKTGDWSWFNKSSKKSPFEIDGKYFKSQATLDKYVTGKFWADYYAIDDVKERQSLLANNPQFQKFKQPETQAEWDAVKKLLKEERNRKLAGVAGFTDTRFNIQDQIEKSKPKGFGGMKRLRYKS